MAAELGQTIGKPLEINENEDFAAASFGLANAYVAGGSMGPQQEEAAVASGQVAIRASVKVTFQLE